MAPSQVPDAFIAKKFGAEPVLLAKPLTFMNRSGDAVAALARYYDIVAGRPAGRRRRSGIAVWPAARAEADSFVAMCAAAGFDEVEVSRPDGGALLAVLAVRP